MFEVTLEEMVLDCGQRSVDGEVILCNDNVLYLNERPKV